MFELRTSRLLLRDLVADDWPAIYAMSQTDGVTQYQSWLRLTSESEARQWVDQAIYHNQQRPRQAYNLAIQHHHSPRVMGWIGWGSANDRTPSQYDCGYVLLPEWWNNGYMTEALQATISYMVETLHATVVSGECASSNQASARVMEKVGFVFAHQWLENNPTTGTTQTYQRYTLDLTTKERTS